MIVGEEEERSDLKKLTAEDADFFISSTKSQICFPYYSIPTRIIFVLPENILYIYIDHIVYNWNNYFQ